MRSHRAKRTRLTIKSPLVIVLTTAGVGLCLIILLVLNIRYKFQTNLRQFPVTVDPKAKTITENDSVNNYLANEHNLFRATGAEAGTSIWEAVHALVTAFSDSVGTSTTANVSGHFVIINPGMRKEQVAAVFGSKLNWTSYERQAFVTPRSNSPLPFVEGTLMPGTYFVTTHMTPVEVQKMVNDRFTKEVLSRYATSTHETVPLKDALTIASIIQRETIGTDGMRLISGILWNRLFIDMNLQVDASLQYVKANTGATSSWWPRVVSSDKYLASAYNTYMHEGLPPTPISNVSIEALLAALNPIETPCIFYFNDPTGTFHCSETYDEHKRLIAEYY